MTVREFAEVTSAGTFVAVKDSNGKYHFSGNVENITGKKIWWTESKIKNIQIGANAKSATVIETY